MLIYRHKSNTLHYRPSVPCPPAPGCTALVLQGSMDYNYGVVAVIDDLPPSLPPCPSGSALSSCTRRVTTTSCPCWWQLPGSPRWYTCTWIMCTWAWGETTHGHPVCMLSTWCLRQCTASHWRSAHVVSEVLSQEGICPSVDGVKFSKCVDRIQSEAQSIPTASCDP